MTTVWRWILSLVLIVVLAACGNADPDTLMTQAREAREQGDYQAATVDLKNVLKQQPDNAEARLQLGEVALILGDLATAENQLRQARELGADPARVQPPLARTLLGLSQYDALLQSVDPSVAESQATAKATLLSARGDAYLAQGQSREAAAAYEAALAADPESVGGHIGLFRVAFNRGATNEAAQRLRTVTDLAPDHALVLLANADLAAREQRLTQAIDLYRQSIEGPGTQILPSQRFLARARLAEVLLTQGKLDETEEVVATMLEQSSRHPTANYIAALVDYQRENFDDATTHLQTVLVGATNSLAAKALLGLVKSRQKQYGQAETYLSEVVAANPENLQARLTLAQVLAQSGQQQRASQVLAEGVRLSKQDPAAMATLAGVAASGGELGKVMQSLAQSGGEAAEGLQVSLGQALIEGGRADDAMTVLSEGTSSDEQQQLQRRRLLIMAALRAGDTQRALREAEILLEERPRDPDAHSLAGGVYLALERFDEARARFERAARLAPDSASPDLNLGLLALAEGNPSKAQETLQRALDKQPDNTTVMVALARAAEAQDDREQAVEWLQRARSTSPEATRPRLLLVRYFSSRGETAKAREIAQELVDAAPERATTQAVLGLAELADGDAARAVDTLGRAVGMAPNAANIRFALARAQLAADKPGAAVSTLEWVRERQPDFLPAASLLALAHLQAGSPQAALETASSLQEQNEAMGAALEGEIRLRMDEPEAASKAFARAAAAGSRQSLGRAVAAAEQAGLEDPIKPVADWVDNHPDDVNARLQLANWYARKQRLAEAIEHYEALVKAGAKDDPGVLNNLAWAYHRRGDERALETARRAHELAPQAAPVLDTLGWIEAREGNLDRAVDLLASAVEKTPDAAEIRYHYAAALAQTEQTGEAVKQLEQALQSPEPFEAKAEAQALLEELRGQ